MLVRCWEGCPTLGGLLEKNISFFFWIFISERILADFFFEIFFSCVLPINSLGQMKKGSVQFLVSLCEDITAWCQKWQISFQTSKLSSLLKEIFTYWQFLVMAVDFISASWALTCWLLSALGRCFYRVKKFPSFGIENFLSFYKFWQFFFKSWIWVFSVNFFQALHFQVLWMLTYK